MRGVGESAFLIVNPKPLLNFIINIPDNINFLM